MARIPESQNSSTIPLPKAELDKKIDSLISEGVKIALKKAESTIAQGDRERDGLIALEKSREALENDIELREAKKTELENSIKELTDKESAIQQSLSLAVAKKNEAEEELRTDETTISLLEMSLTNLTTKKAGLESEIVTLTGDTNRLKKDIEDGILKGNAINDEMHKRNEDLQSEHKIVKDHISEARKTLENLDVQKISASKQLSDLIARKDELGKDITALKVEILQLEDDKFQLALQNDNYKEQLEASYKKKFDDVEARLQLVNEKEAANKLMSDGFIAKKTYLDAYKAKLMQIISGLLVESSLSDDAKKQISDLASKL